METDRRTGEKGNALEMLLGRWASRKTEAAGWRGGGLGGRLSPTSLLVGFSGLAAALE